MSKLVVILADTDEKYLMPLELKFIQELEGRADIQVITDRGYLNSFFSTLQNVDILIINEDLYTTDFNKHNIGNLFLLTESNEVKTQNLSLNRIYKYTSVKEIYNQVITNTNSDSLEPISNMGKTNTIMVYSPSGGIGKTTVAMGISATISRNHKRVLYINTETLQSFNYLLQNKGYCNNGLDKHMTTRSGRILDFVHGALGHEVFDYLLPFMQATSSLNITIDDYNFLIESLKDANLYDYIVIDTTVDFTSEKTLMMSNSDKVLIVTGQDAASAAKLKRLLDNIDCSDANKFIFICNKYAGDLPNYLIGRELSSQCLIREYIKYIDVNHENFSIEDLTLNRDFQKLAYMFL